MAVIPPEQRGVRKGSWGCKDNLLIDSVVCGEVKSYHRNLSVAWIDYQKGFDSVPHDWILDVLEFIRAPDHVHSFLTKAMPLRCTQLQVGYGTNRQTSGNVRIRRGVFQGDSLSPLLFCLSLVPLSHLLYRTSGYLPGPPGNRSKEQKLTHLFYMDDLKSYSSSESLLKTSLEIVSTFSADISMSFGIDKCAYMTVLRGKECCDQSMKLQLPIGEFPFLHEEFYKYLGVQQWLLSMESEIKKSLLAEFKMWPYMELLPIGSRKMSMHVDVCCTYLDILIWCGEMVQV